MRRLAASVAIGLGLCLGVVSPGRADFIVTVGDATVQPGATAVIPVTISSTSGDALDFFGFEFRIASGTRRLEFTPTQPGPFLNASYVFFGNSSDAATGQPLGTVSTKVVPRDTYIGGDATNTGTVNLTGSRLLAQLQVTTSTALPPVPGDTFVISLVTGPNTQFMNGPATVPYTTRAGTVTVSAVPEPNSFALLATAAIVWFAARRACRSRTS